MRRLLLICILLSAGCAVHTPEGASRRLVGQLKQGAPVSGSSAFDRLRATLHLTEVQSTEKEVYRRSARWRRHDQRITLTSSNVLIDQPDTFDIRLTWHPPRALEPELLTRLLGPANGISYTWDDAWLIAGGILEYRRTGTEVPYLLYSSSGYVRDPLDLVEANNLPSMPALETVNSYLERFGAALHPPKREGNEVDSQEFCNERDCIKRFTAFDPKNRRYLAGLEVTAPADEATFGHLFQLLGVPTSNRLMRVIFAAPPATPTDSFAVDGNFALARFRGADTQTVSIWRRVESPRSWCEHTRPDLMRCAPPH